MDEKKNSCEECGKDHDIDLRDAILNMEINVVTLIQLLIDKKIITEEEFTKKMDLLFNTTA